MPRPRRPRARARRRRATQHVPAVIVLLVAVTACDTGDGKQLAAPVDPPPATSTTTTVVAPADDTAPPIAPTFSIQASWPVGGSIDARHTCDGDDLSPALSWSAVPDGAVELALIVTDLDADRFVHWMVLGIDPSVTGAPEGAPPPTGRELTNSFGTPGWAGPCPPAGETHSYQFEIRALDQPASVGDVGGDDVLALLDEVTIATASSIGQYGR